MSESTAPPKPTTPDSPMSNYPAATLGHYDSSQLQSIIERLGAALRAATALATQGTENTRRVLLLSANPRDSRVCSCEKSKGSLAMKGPVLLAAFVLAVGACGRHHQESAPAASSSPASAPATTNDPTFQAADRIIADMRQRQAEAQAAYESWKTRQVPPEVVISRGAPRSASVSAPIPLPQQAPVKTQTEVMHDDAVAMFDSRLQAASKLADEGWRSYVRYKTVCEGKVTTVQQAPVSGVVPDALENRGFMMPNMWIANESTPECRGLLVDFTTKHEVVQQELSSIEDAARIRGIHPGIMRDLFAEYGLKKK